MKRFNITVNGNAYDVQVEEVGAGAAPAAPAAPVAVPAPAAAPVPAAAPLTSSWNWWNDCSTRPFMEPVAGGASTMFIPISRPTRRMSSDVYSAP